MTSIAAEPPVSPAAAGAPARVAPAPSEVRRVAIRLRDGDLVHVGVARSRDEAVELARRAIASLETGEGEWPQVGDRFIRPDAIVSVDVLRWG